LERRKKLLLFVSAALVTVMLVTVVSSTLSSASSRLGPAAQSGSVLFGPPTPIPGLTRTGTYIRIGVNKGGTLGWGNGTDGYGVGFQYPIGPQFESLAIWWWGEGYAVFYKTLSPTGAWVDNKAYWWPTLGWPPPAACKLTPVSFASVRNDANRAIIKAVLRTTDGALLLEFTFSFPKPQKYVLLETKISNLGNGTLRDVLYKRIVDWDIHWATTNSWTSDSHSAYASYFNATLKKTIELSVSGYTPTELGNLPAYVDLMAWDDIGPPPKRGPGVNDFQSHNSVLQFDGNAAIYYDLGEMAGRTAKTVYTVYQAGWNYLIAG